MNKAELITRLAEVTGQERRVITSVVIATFETIAEQLKSGGEVQIVGFGTFAARWRKPRLGVDIRNTSRRVQQKAMRVPRFKAGPKLRESLKDPALKPPL